MNSKLKVKYNLMTGFQNLALILIHLNCCISNKFSEQSHEDIIGNIQN